MHYEAVSLIAQTALFVYSVVYAWRVRHSGQRAAVPVFVFSGAGLFVLLSNQITQVLDQMRTGGPSDARELIEAFGFVCMFISVHLYHTRQLSVERTRSDAADRLRSVLPEDPLPEDTKTHAEGQP